MSAPRIGLVVISLLLLGLAPAYALDAVPIYEAVSIAGMLRDAHPTMGISSAAALNQRGDTVGSAIIDNEYHAFIYTKAHGVALLPPLAAWTSHIAVDVTDPDANGHVLIAGSAQGSIYSNPARAVLWVYDVLGGTAVETIDIGVLPGFGASGANAVNNNGLVVGSSRADESLGPIQPMVFDASDRSLHPLPLSFTPVDINDRNQVAGATSRAVLVRDPASGAYVVETLEDLGRPQSTNSVGIAAINGLGWVAGTAGMTYHDGAGRLVKGAARYTEAWAVVWANSAFDSGTGINGPGDVVGTLGVRSAIRASLYIEALDRVFLLEDLQDPWGFVDAALDINDAGWIAGGHAGAVLLKRIGDMPPPAPPADLTAVPHEPTWQQPWNAITLSWQNTSTLTRSYSIERRVSGTIDWLEIRSGWSNQQLWDASVDLGVTYDYRVRAEGIGGFSDYSNIATATAPSEPVDREPPVAVFIAPLNGDTVKGNVTVVVDVTDNVALNYIELTGPGGTICSEILGGATSAFTLQCAWNTRGLSTGPYTLQVYASDTMVSAVRESIQVQVIGTGLCNRDGICSPGEDCVSCPNDCPGQDTGKPSKRWCCGDGVCSGAEDGFLCALDCGAAPVCGDGVCDPGEDACSCAADCAAGDPCTCAPRSAACATGADCCSGVCKKNGRCG